MEPKYQCKNVVASGHSTTNLSRLNLLNWINNLLGLKLQKVEALCSGSVYCQIMDMLFPGCVSLKKVKFDAVQTHEFWSNFKQLQISFRAVGCEKNVPIDSLIKGRFQENFEFLQWFKRFYDVNAAMTPCATKEKILESQQSTSKVHTRPIANITPISKQSQAEKEMKAQLLEYEGRAEKVLQEKDFYFNKLRNIEILCTSEDAATTEKESLVNKILAELYATEEGFEPPEEEDD